MSRAAKTFQRWRGKLGLQSHERFRPSHSGYVKRHGYFMANAEMFDRGTNVSQLSYE